MNKKLPGGQNIAKKEDFNMQKRYFLFMTIVLFGLTGCSDSPMTRLKNSHYVNGRVVYPIMSDADKAYWRWEMGNDTEVWKEAVAYCKGREDNPACIEIKNKKDWQDLHPNLMKF